MTALDIDGSADSPLKRIKLDVTTASFNEMMVADFMTRRSRNFFDDLHLPCSFLTVDPSEWEDRDNYKAATEFA